MREPSRVPEGSRASAAVDIVDDHLVSRISPAAFEAEQSRAPPTHRGGNAQGGWC